jgi:endoglycosylceramidase
MDRILVAVPALLAALAAVAAGTLALAATAVAATQAGGGWSGAGMVQAPGGPYMTDAFGRKLEFHGTNLVAKCGGGAIDLTALGSPCVGPAQGPRLAYVLSPTAADPGRRFTAADARTLAALGFNVVRVGVIWEGLEPGPKGIGINDPIFCTPHRAGTPFPRLGRFDPYDPGAIRAYLSRTDKIVDELAAAGIRVIIDMHSDVWGSAFSEAGGATPWNGEGAPPWATCTGRYRFRPPPGWGDGYLSKAVQTAIHHFWANDVRVDLQAQYARVWAAVARHYRGDPEVIGYDVFNEPNDFLVKDFDPELECDYGGPRREPASCAAAGHPNALPGGLIGAIQAADPTHVVLYEPSGGTDFGAPETIGITEPLRFPRLALAFHVYGPIPGQLAETARERDATKTDQPGGPAWIMDEFGASDNAAGNANVVNYADSMNISWAYWAAMQLHDPTGGDGAEGLLDQTTRRPYVDMAQAVAVPYPWATAGSPGPQSFDRTTQTYRYRYEVDPKITAPTLIEIPSYTYPFGYTVRVAGGRVRSAADASLLRVAADRHATHVEITVLSLTGFPFPRY